MERGFPVVRVRGEVSDLSRSPRGHLYFTLKEERHALSAIMWSSTARRLGNRLGNILKEGSEIRVQGKVTIFTLRNHRKWSWFCWWGSHSCQNWGIKKPSSPGRFIFPATGRRVTPVSNNHWRCNFPYRICNQGYITSFGWKISSPGNSLAGCGSRGKLSTWGGASHQGI